MYKIIWLENAINDLTKLKHTLAKQDNTVLPKAALAIKTTADILQINPYLGQPHDHNSDFRDVIVPFGLKTHLLRYRIQENTVYIVEVVF